jgi:hypothetical protein
VRGPVGAVDVRAALSRQQVDAGSRWDTRTFGALVASAQVGAVHVDLGGEWWDDAFDGFGTTRAVGFVHASARFGPLRLEGGMRTVHTSTSLADTLTWEPRLGAQLAVSPSTTLLAYAARRATPTYADLLDSDVFGIGIASQLGQRAHVRAEAFVRHDQPPFHQPGGSDWTPGASVHLRALQTDQAHAEAGFTWHASPALGLPDLMGYATTLTSASRATRFGLHLQGALAAPSSTYLSAGLAAEHDLTAGRLELALLGRIQLRSFGEVPDFGASAFLGVRARL